MHGLTTFEIAFLARNRFLDSCPSGWTQRYAMTSYGLQAASQERDSTPAWSLALDGQHRTIPYVAIMYSPMAVKIVRLAGIIAVGCGSHLSKRTSGEEKSHVTQEHRNAYICHCARLFVV